MNNIKIITEVKNDTEKVIIYCHGLGSKKEIINRFKDKLLENNIGVVAFDFPGHGEDKTNFSKFNLDLCISYLEEVIEKYKDKQIYLLGSSYGGFVILNKLIRSNKYINNTILLSPAVNFLSIVNRKLNIDINYFNNHEYIDLYNNIRIYKDAYIDYKENEDKVYNYKFTNINIIHGTLDKTVLLKDIEYFSKKNNLNLKIVKNAKHELIGYEDEIIDFIIDNIGE